MVPAAPPVGAAPIGTFAASFPGATPPVAPPPGPLGSEGAEPRISRGQIGAIVAVGVLVLALFGYMVANTGPDTKREQAIAAGEKALSADADVTAVGPTTTAPNTSSDAPATTSPALTTTTLDPDEARDRTAFCSAARTLTSFELHLAAAEVDKDFPELSSLVRSDRATWAAAVATLRRAGPPRTISALDQYAALYHDFLDAVAASSSFPDLGAHIDLERLKEAPTIAAPINGAFRTVCGAGG